MQWNLLSKDLFVLDLNKKYLIRSCFHTKYNTSLDIIFYNVCVVVEWESNDSLHRSICINDGEDNEPLDIDAATHFIEIEEP